MAVADAHDLPSGVTKARKPTAGAAAEPRAECTAMGVAAAHARHTASSNAITSLSAKENFI